eukprot:1378563-Rhodomonas_salina.2
MCCTELGYGATRYLELVWGMVVLRCSTELRYEATCAVLSWGKMLQHVRYWNRVWCYQVHRVRHPRDVVSVHVSGAAPALLPLAAACPAQCAALTRDTLGSLSLPLSLSLPPPPLPTTPNLNLNPTARADR